MPTPRPKSGPIPTLESIFAPFLSQDCQLCGVTTPAVLCANCDGELP
ncbi:MAG: hypothetical protein JNM52_10180, partial [Betaproteobacteria bacterium]|nr:hypothetical protein [Betaproteobacteria bacterium]